jgi:hypothetical protein
MYSTPSHSISSCPIAGSPVPWQCTVCCDSDWEGYFEGRQLASKDTFIFKVAVELDILYGIWKVHTVHCHVSLLTIINFYHRFPVQQYATSSSVNLLSNLQWILVPHQSFGDFLFPIWIPTSIKHLFLPCIWPACLCEQVVVNEIRVFVEILCEFTLHVYIKRWVYINFLPVSPYYKNFKNQTIANFPW